MLPESKLGDVKLWRILVSEERSLSSGSFENQCKKHQKSCCSFPNNIKNFQIPHTATLKKAFIALCVFRPPYYYDSSNNKTKRAFKITCLHENSWS